jgi:predicted nucleic acid-binding protein
MAIFIDTGYILALINTSDEYHERASAIASEIVGRSPELFDRAVKLYSPRMDKEWGMTDCISFTVMQDMEVIDALTTDDHFRQAGFRALLIE